MDSAKEALLKKYTEAVVNSPFNLTSDRDFDKFWNRHVMDAVRLRELIPPQYIVPSARVLDVGSGNGVPGIPLAIIEPTWTINMLDSNNKKCLFIDTFCKNNVLKNVSVICDRAETVAHGKLRGRFDIVFSRALGKYRSALELCGAFVKVGGILIVPHGTSWESEVEGSQPALEAMGLILLGVKEYWLQDIAYYGIILKKDKESQLSYPRAIGIPTKKPL